LFVFCRILDLLQVPVAGLTYELLYHDFIEDQLVLNVDALEEVADALEADLLVCVVQEGQ